MPFFYILRTAGQMDYTKNNITFLKKLFLGIGLIFLLFAFWSIYWLVSVLHFGDLVAITKTEAGKEQDWQPQRTEKEYLPFEPDELKVFVPVERINAYVLQGIEGNIKTKYLHKTLQKTSRRSSKSSFAKSGSNSAVNEAFRKDGDEVVKKHLVNTVMRLSDSLRPFAKQSDIGQGQISRLLRSYPFISDGFYKSPDEYKPLSYNDLQDLLKAVSKEQKNLVKTQLPQAVFKLATTLSPLPEPVS
ncbi:MAG: hypothetical protein GX221_09145 [Candidatus Riflebacteria bacterium]|nr:hypothetical protein [Candidatus Riflebacteria bacterium]